MAALVVAAAGIGIYMAVAPVPVEAVAIAPSPASDTFTEQGVYTYDKSYTVFPLVSGEVLEVSVKEGDKVLAGDVLAVVDAVDYREQIEQLTASIAGYNAQIDNLGLQDQQQRDSYSTQLAALQGQLATLREEMTENAENSESLAVQISIQESAVSAARSYLRRTSSALRDARSYGDETMIAQARQTEAAAESALAQSELLLEQLHNGAVPDDLYTAQEDALEEQIAALETQRARSYTGGMREYYDAQIESTNLTIAQLEERAGRAEIRAEVAGVVESLPVEDTNMVSQAAPIAVIGTGEFVEVFVAVREIDSVTLGSKVELILDKRLGEETAEGTVAEIAGEAEVKLSPLGVEERKIRVLVKPTEDILEIGYTADVRFTAWSSESALTVPKTAVFTVDGADCVWAIKNGRLARTEVQKGLELGEAYVIESGLSEGDTVVTDANNTALREGKAASRQ